MAIRAALEGVPGSVRPFSCGQSGALTSRFGCWWLLCGLRLSSAEKGRMNPPSFPSAEQLRQMPAADIAALLLPLLPRPQEGSRVAFAPGDFTRMIVEREYPKAHQEEHGYNMVGRHKVADVLMEGIAHLRRAGFVVETGGDSGAMIWFKLSRAGLAAAESGSLLERGISVAESGTLLHPRIRQACLRELESGRDGFDKAYFHAFREVEIALREAAGLPTTLVGVDVVNAALKTGTGAITDQSLTSAEQEGMRFLFAGAILLYKNPHSHRLVGEDDATQVMRSLLFASSLLSIIDNIAREKSGREEVADNA
jgi:uncharacterized protein (TIGR02391 family)